MRQLGEGGVIETKLKHLFFNLDKGNLASNHPDVPLNWSDLASTRGYKDTFYQENQKTLVKLI